MSIPGAVNVSSGLATCDAQVPWRTSRGNEYVLRRWSVGDRRFWSISKAGVYLPYQDRHHTPATGTSDLDETPWFNTADRAKEYLENLEAGLNGAPPPRTKEKAIVNGNGASTHPESARPDDKRLLMGRHWSEEHRTVFEAIEWKSVDVSIKAADGGIVFEQKGVHVPESWSQQAAQIVSSKYFYGDKDHGVMVSIGGREHSAQQLVGRVATQVAEWAAADGTFVGQDDAEIFKAELEYILINQYASFNSPVWFNVGLSQYGLNGGMGNWRWSQNSREAIVCEDLFRFPQVSACFIQSVSDDMDGIMALATSEAMLFKNGSGTGTDLSTLRSTAEKLTGGGKPSGPVSFMRIYDAVASVIKSGGKSRRAAKMQTLKCWHPDIMEFIRCKAKEDDKAKALIAAGWSDQMTGDPDEAYSSVAFQNTNLSVRVTDQFMRMATEDYASTLEVGEERPAWTTSEVTTGNPSRVFDPVEVLHEAALGAWKCGDPGLQFEESTQDWHTCPNTAPINSSNPCSEYVFLDDTACNLASLNLMKFRNEDGSIDVKGLSHAVRVMIIAMETLVDHGSYPTKAIAENSHAYRPLGLGFTNLGALCMSYGYAYDSHEARMLAAAIMALIQGEAYGTSAELAKVHGPFPGFSKNRGPMLEVVQSHRDCAGRLNYPQESACNIGNLCEIAHASLCDAVESGHIHGYRNAQASVIAPTGTISFMMDCDTTGIEPELLLVKYKNLAGGGQMKIVNQAVAGGLRALGYGEAEVSFLVKYAEDTGTLYGAPGFDKSHAEVFDTSFPDAAGRSIPWKAHIDMMAAVQPFVSGAISKTVNMPADSTVDDIKEAYVYAWKSGLKAIAVYRDGSKGAQPLSNRSGKEAIRLAVPGTDEAKWRDQEGDPLPADKWGPSQVEAYMRVKAAGGIPMPMEKRRRLPATRPSLTHKFSVGGHEGYITVGLYDDKSPGEVFIVMSKEGSTVGGLMDALGTSVSLGLQYGIPIEVFVSKFAYSKFDPSGTTENGDLPIAHSLVDYVFRWLAIQFLEGGREQYSPRGLEAEGSDDAGAEADSVTFHNVTNATWTPAGGAPIDLLGAKATFEMHPLAKVHEESPGAQDLIRHLRTLEATRRHEKIDRAYRAATSRPAAPGPLCRTCGHVTRKTGPCNTCPNCGNSEGCG